MCKEAEVEESSVEMEWVLKLLGAFVLFSLPFLSGSS